MTVLRVTTLFGLAVLAAGCTSSSGVICSFKDKAVIDPNAPWPKFHHDRQNTGVSAAAIPAAIVQRWVFDPAPDQVTRAPITAPPVLNGPGTTVYIGSTDGTLYALDAGTGARVTQFDVGIGNPITGAALVATRQNTEAV